MIEMLERVLVSARTQLPRTVTFQLISLSVLVLGRESTGLWYPLYSPHHPVTPCDWSMLGRRQGARLDKHLYSINNFLYCYNNIS
jgi:hypothetical protein